MAKQHYCKRWHGSSPVKKSNFGAQAGGAEAGGPAPKPEALKSKAGRLEPRKAPLHQPTARRGGEQEGSDARSLKKTIQTIEKLYSEDTLDHGLSCSICPNEQSAEACWVESVEARFQYMFPARHVSSSCMLDSLLQAPLEARYGLALDDVRG